MTLAEFLAMGGYGFYVWTAYSVVGIGLACNLWLPGRAHRRWLAGYRQQISAPEGND